MSWEVVVGVEVHVQLRTETKLFCQDSVTFGHEPNTHVCPVCLGLPGALPITNPEAVWLAVRAAAALESVVRHRSVWERKHYLYPDLPKGYQITQFSEPLATGGGVVFDGERGEVAVRIRRVHIEEDAGKLLHDRFRGATAIDFNRAGTPLVEIVTEPDLRSAADTRRFLRALKQVLEYADVSDCSMEQGSLRVDVNVSLRRAGDHALGTKTEIKNVNSFSGVEKALGLEIDRQRELLDSGALVEQQTLLWDDGRTELRPMRSKEGSEDYRYFPDPDLPPLLVAAELIREAESSLPEMPRARQRRLARTWGLPLRDAEVLTQSKATADYYEQVARLSEDPKRAAHWVMGPLQALAKQGAADAALFPVAPDALSELLRLVSSGRISEGTAKRVLSILASEGGSPETIVRQRNLFQMRDAAQLADWVAEVLEEFPDEAARFRAGGGGVLDFLVGEVMRRSEGRADPRAANELIRAALSS